MTLPDLQERRQNDPRRMIQNAIRPAAPDQDTETLPDLQESNQTGGTRSGTPARRQIHGTPSGSMIQRGSVDTVRIIPAG